MELPIYMALGWEAPPVKTLGGTRTLGEPDKFRGLVFDGVNPTEADGMVDINIDGR